MNKKNVASFFAGMAVMAVIGTAVYSAGHGGAASSSRLGDRYEAIENKLDTIDKTISNYYLNAEDIDTDKLEEGLYSGYVAGLEESYSTYYTPEDFADVMESTSGSYSGIGAYVSQDMNTGIISIAKPFEGGPADMAGIQKDDIIFKVSGEEVTGQDLSKVVARMKGEAGTQVELTIYRPWEDAYIDFTVDRAVVDVPTVEWQMLDDQVGYIQIVEFEEVTAGQFKTAEEEWAKDDDALDLPMAVLVNGNTASASEIFTGALKDYGVAEIIGTTTFGKGIVQSIIPMKDGSAVKLTTAKYYTPSGVCIHGVGIEPDIIEEFDRESDTDNQLQAALDYLNQN